MEIILAVLLAMFAGAMNGSYAFPIKNIQRTSPVNLIWLIFSILTFLIMPWITNLLLNTQALHFLAKLPSNLVWTELLSGFIFGLGMVIFTYSLKYIGIGISFLLNIGTGTILSTLLPILILRVNAFGKWFGILELIAMLVFFIGILSAILASQNRHKLQNTYKNTYKGIVFGVISGVLTSGQGFAYSYALPTIKQIAAQHAFSQLSAANLSWILLFNAAFIPYFIFFLISSVRNKEINCLKKSTVSNISQVALMAILYFICLILFSQSTLLVGNFGAVISWPLLMIFIILTSNFWGIIQGEWRNVNQKTKKLLTYSILLMIIAVIILAYNGYLNTK